MLYQASASLLYTIYMYLLWLKFQCLNHKRNYLRSPIAWSCLSQTKDEQTHYDPVVYKISVWTNNRSVRERERCLVFGEGVGQSIWWLCVPDQSLNKWLGPSWFIEWPRAIIVPWPLPLCHISWDPLCITNRGIRYLISVTCMGTNFEHSLKENILPL